MMNPSGNKRSLLRVPSESPSFVVLRGTFLFEKISPKSGHLRKCFTLVYIPNLVNYEISFRDLLLTLDIIAVICIWTE